jgi:hypothetical protein
MLKSLRTISILLMFAAAALTAPAFAQQSTNPQAPPMASPAAAASPEAEPSLSAEQLAAKKEEEKGTPEQQELSRDIAEAISAKDFASMKDLFAPSAVKCIGNNQDFLIDRIKKQFTLPMSTNFHLTVTKLPADIPRPTKYATFPMRPTHLMSLDFTTNNGDGATVDLLIGQDDSEPPSTMTGLTRFLVLLVISLAALAMLAVGVLFRSFWWLGGGLAAGAFGLLVLVGNPFGQGHGDWYEAQPCPTQEGLKRFAAQQKLRAEDQARVKAAVADLKDPLKSQLLALIGQHATSKAWNLCMASLKEDFSTCQGLVATLSGHDND